MIAQATAGQLSRWQPTSEAALRQCGQLAAYGAQQPFLRFYEDDNGNRLSILDGAATLYAAGNTAELRLFLTMDPTVRSVRTDRETARLLAADWGVPYESGVVTEAPPLAEKAVDSAFKTASDVSLRAVYPVLKICFEGAMPPFDAWYADVHHRFRRGLCRAVGFAADAPVEMPEQQLVACAMTVAECDDAALIGAVATLPSARGRGFASACVLTLTAQLQREGKRVLLSPKNEHARRIYEHIGFTPCGEWGTVYKLKYTV